jgi:hypothetical protein
VFKVFCGVFNICAGQCPGRNGKQFGRFGHGCNYSINAKKDNRFTEPQS